MKYPSVLSRFCFQVLRNELQIFEHLWYFLISENEFEVLEIHFLIFEIHFLIFKIHFLIFENHLKFQILDYEF